jgi:hypothetical protein
VRGAVIRREKILVPLPHHVLQRAQEARCGLPVACPPSLFFMSCLGSGPWTYGEGEASEANIPTLQFDEDQGVQHLPHHLNRTVVVAVGVVRGHIGHFSHFLVDYVSRACVT